MVIDLQIALKKEILLFLKDLGLEQWNMINMKIIILGFFALLFVVYFYIIEPLFIKQKLKNNNEHGSARGPKRVKLKRIFQKKKI